MGFAIETEWLGKPTRIHVDTIEELRELLGYGNVVKTRAVAVKRTARRREPKERGPNAATRTNKGAKTKRATNRGWGPEVFELAKARNMSPLKARSELAKRKRAAKGKATTKGKPDAA